MIRRPLNERFVTAVQTGIKVTTIRNKPWPVGKPIMLYHWLGKPYASKQQDFCAVVVKETRLVKITHCDDGRILYTRETQEPRPLWATEGFTSGLEMDAWFRPLVKPGQTVEKHLMIFQTLHSQN